MGGYSHLVINHYPRFLPVLTGISDVDPSCKVMLWSTGGFVGITKCSDFAQMNYRWRSFIQGRYIFAETVGVIRLNGHIELCIICIAMARETMYLYDYASELVHLERAKH